MQTTSVIILLFYVTGFSFLTGEFLFIILCSLGYPVLPLPWSHTHFCGIKDYLPSLSSTIPSLVKTSDILLAPIIYQVLLELAGI